MKKIIIFILPFLLLGFKSTMTNKSTKECIVGTWISEEDSNSKRVFNSNGRSFSYYQDELLASYNYKITEEMSKNNKIKHEFLELIDISDNTDSFNYEINAIDDNILVLEYLDGVRKLQSFRREKK